MVITVVSRRKSVGGGADGEMAFFGGGEKSERFISGSTLPPTLMRTVGQIDRVRADTARRRRGRTSGSRSFAVYVVALRARPPTTPLLLLV